MVDLSGGGDDVASSGEPYSAGKSNRSPLPVKLLPAPEIVWNDAIREVLLVRSVFEAEIELEQDVR